MIDLICIDVDGTLVGTAGVVPEAVWDAAARARARGIRLAVCTGRPAMGRARVYAERLDASGWHVFQNGASVVHLGTGESRSRHLSQRAVEWLKARARATGWILELYTDDDYATESGADRARRHAELLGVPFRPRALSTLEDPIVRGQWLVSPEEVDDVVAEPHEDIHLSLSHAPQMPDTVFVNVTPADVDKASAVRVIADALGARLERTMMVGDSLNDLSVMRIVGHPVAMGNAAPEVHAAARHRVAHVDDGGLAEALELAMRLGDLGGS